jgi:hypothetical protein
VITDGLVSDRVTVCNKDATNSSRRETFFDEGIKNSLVLFVERLIDNECPTIHVLAQTLLSIFK